MTNSRSSSIANKLFGRPDRSDPWRDAPLWAWDLRSEMGFIIWQNGVIMATFDELKANQDAIIELVGKVAADVQSLHDDLNNIPTPGMTPEQQTALDDAVTKSGAIKDSLAGIDALTADKTTTPTPTPDPVPTPTPDT